MDLAALLPAYAPLEEPPLLAYLEGLYHDVFTPEAIRQHLVNHVGYEAAAYGLAVASPLVPKGGCLLDVGAGFGSFVLMARNAGFDARGVEIAPFEVEFARRRLARLRPQDDPAIVFRQGDAVALAEAESSLDAVTFWNVFEHVERVDGLVAFSRKALKTGGHVFIVCPNYAAKRQEAHYHVPWEPDLRHDRVAAAAYIRSLGRDPRFFETSIFCRTNAEVLGLLRRHDFDLIDMEGLVPMSLRPSNLAQLLRNWRKVLAFHDPARPSVLVVGRKRA